MASRQFAFKGFIGIGHESPTAYGTKVARTSYARFVDSDIQRSHNEDPVQTSRLMAAEDVSLGDYDVTFTGKVEARPESTGAFLKAFAGNGSVTTTTPGGGINSRQHDIVPQDTRQPVTLERRVGTLNKSEVVGGGVFEEIGLEFARSTLMLGYKGVGQKDQVDQAPSTPTFDTQRALLKHEAVVTLNGATVGVKSARVTMQREVTKDDYETGNRYRVDADVGASKLTAQYELNFRDLTLLKRSLGSGATSEPTDTPAYNADKLVVTGPVIEGAIPYKLELSMPKCFWKPIGLPMQGKEGIVQRVQAEALYDETAGHQWKAVLTNTKTTL